MLAPTNPYEPLVRETLSRLASQLNSGLLRVQREADGSRLVVRAPGHGGRDIVVPCDRSALLPPPALPPRCARGLLSQLTLPPVQIGGKRVNVPHWAIVRNHDVMCAEMPRHVRDLHPASVVVISTRGAEDGTCIYGWYIRLAATPHELIRLPGSHLWALADLLMRDHVLRESSLITDYWDCFFTSDEPGGGFSPMAASRFARFRKRAAASAKAVTGTPPVTRKRSRDEERDAAVDAAALHDTCVICLDESPTAQPRCTHSSCRTLTCARCHNDSRGLCPICDRSAINADYPCSSCNRLFPLRQYGLPCVGCAANSLCHECYSDFRECGACECE